MLRKISGTVLTVLLRSAYPYTGRLLRPSSLGGTARLEATQTAHLSVPTPPACAKRSNLQELAPFQSG